MEVPLSNYCVELSIILTGPFVIGNTIIVNLNNSGRAEDICLNIKRKPSWAQVSVYDFPTVALPYRMLSSKYFWVKYLVNGAVLTALERAGIQLLTVISAYVFSGSLWAEDDGAD